MASLFSSRFFFILFLFLFTSSSIALKPKTTQLLLPVTKDSATLQYITEIQQRTPPISVKLTIDLGGSVLWVDCEPAYYDSSSYEPSKCGSLECSLAHSKTCMKECNSQRPGCYNNTCIRLATNSINQFTDSGQFGGDLISIQSTNGFNPVSFVSIPNTLFSCSSHSLLADLANDVKGMAGLGRFEVGLPSQFSKAFKFGNRFAMCLSSSTTSKGVIFFGDGPYVLLPGIDVSKSLSYTPLVLNPKSTVPFIEGEASSEYFIGVKGIKVNGKNVPLNTSLLSIDRKGFGGTKISTVHPYTALETSIYRAFKKVFIREMIADHRVKRVKAVKPFGACFSSKNIGRTRVGPAVPTIDLVLQKENVNWRIFGANSMVSVNDEVLCLGFVDGGNEYIKTPIIIGGHQLEDNLLQFDLANKSLGFSSSLLFSRTTCSNFNFTTSV